MIYVTCENWLNEYGIRSGDSFRLVLIFLSFKTDCLGCLPSMKLDDLGHLDMGIGQLTELIGDISVCKCVEYNWNEA